MPIRKLASIAAFVSVVAGAAATPAAAPAATPPPEASRAAAEDRPVIRDILDRSTRNLLAPPEAESHRVYVRLKTGKVRAGTGIDSSLAGPMHRQPWRAAWKHVAPALRAAGLLDAAGLPVEGEGLLMVVAHDPATGEYLAHSFLLRDRDPVTRIVGEALWVGFIVVPDPAGPDAAVYVSLAVDVERRDDPARGSMAALAGALSGRLGMEARTAAGGFVHTGSGTLAVPYGFAGLRATWTVTTDDRGGLTSLDSLYARQRALETRLVALSAEGLPFEKDDNDLLKQTRTAIETALHSAGWIEHGSEPFERVSRSHFGAALAWSFTRFEDAFVDEAGVVRLEDESKAPVYAVGVWYPWGVHAGGDGSGDPAVAPLLMAGPRIDFDDLEPLFGAGVSLRHHGVASFLSITPWAGVTSRVMLRTGEGVERRSRENEVVWGIAVGLGP